ncbi:energy transducer TonB [Bacteroidota bacterium]
MNQIFTWLFCLAIFMSASVCHAQDLGKIYAVVDQMPEFPGGEMGLFEYFEAIPVRDEFRKTEKVWVRFVVDTLGQVQNVEIPGGFDEGFINQTVISYVQAMPAWKPGKSKGKTVAVQCIIPVPYGLIEEETSRKKTTIQNMERRW